MEIHFKQDNSLLNHFVGRRKELGQLHQSFLHQNMILVMGLRGIGKSTLIRMFLKKNHKKSVWISLEPSESKENFENGLFLAIKSHFQYSELGQDLQQLLEFLENQKIVLIIDDFQYLEEEFALNLLNQLRTTFYDSKSIIITNKRPKLNDLELLDLSAQTIKSLKEIDSKRLIKYFLNLHEHQKNIDTSLETLQQTLSGHPYVIKLYLSQLLQVNSIDESKFYQDIYTDLLQNIVASLDNNDLWKLKELSLIRKTMSKKVVVPLLGDSLRLLCNLFIVEFDVESRHYQIPVVLKRSLQSTMISAELVQAHSNIFSVLSHGNQRVSYEEVYYHAKEAKLWIQLIDYSLLQFEKHLLQGLDYFCIQEMYLDELLALDISYKKDQLYLYKCEYRITNVDSKGALEVIKVISCDKVALFCKTRLDSMKGNKKVAAKAFETCLLLDFSKGQKIIILFQLSYVYIHLKKLQKAESNLEVLKGHFKGLSEQGDYHCKSILASIKYNQQSYEEALILCFEMESYYQKSQNLYALGETQFYIICSYMGLEKYDQALLCCENHKLVLRKLKDDTSWFFYHSRLSIIYQKQGKMVFAVQEAKKAIDIARKKNWDLSLLLETYRLSLIYLDQKKFLEGQKYIEESLNLSQSLNRPDERALCLMTLARIHMISKRNDLAKEKLEELHHFISAKQSPMEIQSLFFLLKSDLLSEDASHGEAKVQKKKYQELYDGLGPIEKRKIKDHLDWYLRLVNHKIQYQLFTQDQKVFLENEIELQSYLDKKIAFDLFYYEGQVFCLGIEVDFSKHKLQLKLLEAIIRNAKAHMTQQELISRVWGKELVLDKDKTHLRVQLHKIKSRLNLQLLSKVKQGIYQINPELAFCFIIK